MFWKGNSARTELPEACTKSDLTPVIKRGLTPVTFGYDMWRAVSVGVNSRLAGWAFRAWFGISSTRQVSLFWTITTPPSRARSLTPSTPSPPSPDRTTAQDV